MTLDALDPVIHAPKRLAITAMLAAAEFVESAYLRQHLDLRAPDLSKQMSRLADAGYVTVKKTGGGPTLRTWYRITPEGRAAYDRHMAALRALASDRPAESVADPEAVI